MIIYFAGDGKKEEDDQYLLALNNPNWGVLMSYKSIKTLRDNEGSSRFKRIIKRMKNEHVIGRRRTKTKRRRRKTAD